jgi:hypothetical protein
MNHMSPFVIPLGAFLVAIVAIVTGAAAAANKQRLKAEQRMAMVARGMNAEDIDKLLSTESRPVKDQSISTTRRIAIVLISTAVGLCLFFLTVAWITREPEVLNGVAIGLIPLAIGIGFLIDYKLQKRDLERLGGDLG